MYFMVENKTVPFYYNVSRQLSAIPHLHSHIEVVYVRSGSVVCAADSIESVANAGDLYISFPNQIHHYHHKTKIVDHDLIIFSHELSPELTHLITSKVPIDPVYKNANKNSVLMSTLDAYRNCYKRNDSIDEGEMRGLIIVLVSEILRNMPLTDVDVYDTHIVKDVIGYCYENYMSDISLQSVSEALHTSRYYISRIFSKKLNIGFNEYINSLRIKNACNILKSGKMTITEVAYAVGYNTPRSFNRCFLEIKGVTPKEYRESHMKQNI